MAMLRPDEFTVGVLGDAAPLTLLLPRTKYETTFLIGGTAAEPAAICLSGQYKFTWFESAENSAWKGLLIPDVRVEADHGSIVDAEQSMPLGMAVRKGAMLGIAARTSESFGRASSLISVHTGLAEARSGHSAGFTRWSVVLGHGDDRRELFTLDLLAADD